VLTVKPRWTNNCATLQHGQWIPWVEKNLPFGRIEASRYMRVYNQRAELNVSSMNHLTEAINQLSTPKPKKEPVKVEAELVDI